MAQVAEIPTETHGSAPDSDLQGDRATEKKSKKGTSLPPIASIVTDEAFYAYVAALKPEDWPRVAIYFYRHLPVILRDPSNIHKIDGEAPAEPLNRAFVLREFGSGKYNFKLNDKGSGGRTLTQCNPDYNFPEHPPKFDIRELDTNAKQNRLLVEKLKREGKLTQDGEVIVPQQNGSSDAGMATALKDIAIEAMRGRQEKPGLEGQAFGKMMDMMSNASSKSIEIALSQLKRDEKTGADPMMVLIMQFMMKQLELSDKRANLPPPAPPVQDNTLINLLMQQLDHSRKESAAERQRNHELQIKMLEAKTEAADPMDMVDKVLGIQERLGGGQQTKRAGWPGLLEDHAEQLLDLGKTAIGAFTGYRRGQEPRPQQQQRPPQNETTVQSQPAPVVQMPSIGETPVQVQDPEIAFLLPIFEKFGSRLVKAFADDPNSGAEVAHHIASPLLAGRAEYERIARMGREKILATMDLIPQMKADALSVGTQEMLNDFIDDFIAGPNAGPEDEDEEDDEPVEIPEATTTRRRKKVGA